MRDEFPDFVRRVLAARAGYRCSNPSCRASTSGPKVDPTKALNIGVAAHIAAASSGGPRFDPAMSAIARKHPENGIWLCQNCAKMVDDDPLRFGSSALLAWKEDAEAVALAEIGQRLVPGDRLRITPERIDLLAAAAQDGDMWFLSTMQGAWVRSGQTDFHDREDPSYDAIYVDALEDLQRMRLVRRMSSQHFAMTGRGFRIARAITARSSKE